MANSYIHSFLKMLQAAKGPGGSMELKMEHWAPPAPRDRSAIYDGARSLGNAGAATISVPPDDVILRPDGALRIGEYVELSGRMPRNGYLTIFNLGTSGACSKLFPTDHNTDNLFRAGDAFRVPSERILSRAAFARGEWEETGPTTAETGECERLLTILTITAINLEVGDLHAKLAECAPTSRGAGFGGAVQVDTPRLFTLPSEDWDYGLVAAEVVG